MQSNGKVSEGTVYDMINRATNKEKYSLAWPNTIKEKIMYLIKMPLTHTQAITIPYPGKGNESYYPLTLTLAITWIWFYSYLICWFTYSVTVALDIRFGIIPMFLYPFGISLRDIKKYTDFKLATKKLKEDLPDQEILLAEAFQG